MAIPSVPTGHSAEVGNEKAILSWGAVPTATSYDTRYAIKRTEVVSSFTRNSAKDISFGPVASFDIRGATTDNTTIWFSNNSTNMAEAYVASNRTRDATKDISIGSDAEGLATNGTTLWVFFFGGDTALAYNISTKARDSSKDIPLGRQQFLPAGGVIVGDTLWVVFGTQTTALAYNVTTRTRDSSKDITLGTGNWRAGFTDGQTIWFLELTGRTANAYSAATLARLTTQDLALTTRFVGPFAVLAGSTLFVGFTTGTFAERNQVTTTLAYDFSSGVPDPVWINGPQDVTDTTATITGLTNATVYLFQVRATNNDGDSAWSSSLEATPTDLMPSFGSDTVTNQSYEEDYAIDTLQLPEVTGGDGPITYTATPLPAGLAFNTGTRQITGLPTNVGTTTVSYKATDADGDVATLTFMIVITPDSMPTFGSTTIQNQDYSKDFAISALQLPEAQEGSGTLTYSTSTLPSGLVFNASTRQITGLPDTLGTTTITYTVTDADGDTASLMFVIRVQERAARPPDNLTATASEGEVDLTWDAVPRATSYDIRYRENIEPGVATFTHDPRTDFSLGNNVRSDIEGILTDGTIIWFLDNASDRAEAYVLNRFGQRVRDDTFNINLTSAEYKGVATNSTTAWFFIEGNPTAQAYNLSTRSRDAAKDINIGFTRARGGVVVDGIMWVAALGQDTAHAFDVSNKSREATRDIEIGSRNWASVFTDNLTIWFVDDTGMASAYLVRNGERSAGQDTQFGGERDSVQSVVFLSSGSLLVGSRLLTISLRTFLITVKWYAEQYDFSTTRVPVAWSNGPQNLTTNSGTVTGLNNLTEYEFQVRSRVGGIDSVWSDSSLATPNAGFGFLSAISHYNLRVDNEIDSITLPAAVGGTPPYTYSLTGLPVGLMFNSNNRTITGTPTVVGAPSTITYTVTDANSNTHNVTFTITITGPLTLESGTLNTVLLPVGQEITPIILPEAVGGIPPYTYNLYTRVAIGAYSLYDIDVDGITFDPNTRTLSGAATNSRQIGRSIRARYEAVDSTGTRRSIFFNLAVVQPPATTYEPGDNPLAGRPPIMQIIPGDSILDVYVSVDVQSRNTPVQVAWNVSGDPTSIQSTGPQQSSNVVLTGLANGVQYDVYARHYSYTHPALERAIWSDVFHGTPTSETRTLVREPEFDVHVPPSRFIELVFSNISRGNRVHLHFAYTWQSGITKAPGEDLNAWLLASFTRDSVPGEGYDTGVFRFASEFTVDTVPVIGLTGKNYVGVWYHDNILYVLRQDATQVTALAYNTHNYERSATNDRVFPADTRFVLTDDENIYVMSEDSATIRGFSSRDGSRNSSVDFTVEGDTPYTGLMLVGDDIAVLSKNVMYFYDRLTRTASSDPIPIPVNRVKSVGHTIDFVWLLDDYANKLEAYSTGVPRRTKFNYVLPGHDSVSLEVEGNTHAERYEIRYKLSSEDDSNFNTQTSTSTAFKVTGLSPSSDYIVDCRTVIEPLQSEWTRREFTTLPEQTEHIGFKAFVSNRGRYITDREEITWLEITDYVESLDSQTGRVGFTQLQPVTSAVMRLNNNDRTFSRNLYNSIEITQGKVIRLLAYIGSEVFPVFFGTVQSVKTVHKGSNSTLVVRVYDIMAVYNKSDITIINYGGNLTIPENIHYILDRAGFPQSSRNIDPDDDDVTRFVYTEESGTVGKRLATAAAAGLIYGDSSGGIVYVPREELLRRIRAPASFSIGNGQDSILISEPELVLDERDIINSWKVVGPNTNPELGSVSAPIQRTSSSSVFQHGLRQKTLVTYLAHEGLTVELALYLLSVTSTPRGRLDDALLYMDNLTLDEKREVFRLNPSTVVSLDLEQEEIRLNMLVEKYNFKYLDGEWSVSISLIEAVN